MGRNAEAMATIGQSKFLKLKRKEQRARRLQEELDQVRAEWDKIRDDLEHNHNHQWVSLCRENNLAPSYEFEDVLA